MRSGHVRRNEWSRSPEYAAKRILKVLHYFSHANNIEQISGNNDHICDIEAAVGDLMVALKENDPMHLEALEAAIAA
jgi:hypothetical protein